MYKDNLTSIGLTDNEANVYEWLLHNGEMSAGDIIDGIGLKRGNTYNVLEALVQKQIIIQTEKNKIAHFKIDNPNALLEYIDRNKEALEHKRATIESIIPALISKFNLSTNKPVVSYYEGENGIEYVINDTLTSNTELLQYMDLDEIHKHIKSISKNYLEKRVSRSISKKIITLDSEYARNYYKDAKDLTETKFIERGQYRFDVSMHIYDNKVSYFSFANGKLIGVIIEDSKIYEMHKKVFLELFKSI